MTVLVVCAEQALPVHPVFEEWLRYELLEARRARKDSEAVTVDDVCTCREIQCSKTHFTSTFQRAHTINNNSVNYNTSSTNSSIKHNQDASPSRTTAQWRVHRQASEALQR